MGKTEDPGDGRFNFYSGEHMLLRGEPAQVKAAVQKIGIDLNDYNPHIVGIYARPRSVGFDFFTNSVKALLKAVEDNPVLHEDDRNTKVGAFMASNSKGLSFRQEGEETSLHFIISFTNVCNVHIDTHGLRDSCEYGSLSRVLGHGYWDLAPDKVPGAFFSLGDTGTAGLMIAPMKGVDGQIRTVVGIQGRW